MKELFVSYILSPLGYLKITSTLEALVELSFADELGADDKEIPVIHNEIARQLEEYFSGKRKIFDLRLAPTGSAFQKEIWKLVQKIPFGDTASYLEVAVASGSDKNTRAVGLANGKNPIPIIIPCHRIIGSNGKLTGYAGGLERKRWLLLHEQNNSKHQLLF